MNDRANKVLDLEQSAFFMPYTANRDFKKSPRMLERAEGMYYWTPEGRKILDGTSGLWCVNAGHCRPKIAEAIAAQARKMDFAPSFQMGHPIAFEFADRLAEIAPKGVGHVFYTNSGSESADTALKIALAQDSVKDFFKTGAYTADWSTPQDLATLGAEALGKWGVLVQQAGIEKQ